jgi:hypothetical protein
MDIPDIRTRLSRIVLALSDAAAHGGSELAGESFESGIALGAVGFGNVEEAGCTACIIA